MLAGLSQVFGQAPGKGGTRLPELVVTPYKNTLIANGKDEAKVKITVINSEGKEIANASNAVQFKIEGDARIVALKGAVAGTANHAKLQNGELWFSLRAGRQKGIIKFDVSGEGLITGSTEIHMVQPGQPHAVTATTRPIAGNAIITDRILGADISFLPQLEARGMKFYDAKGQQEDPVVILKKQGFNYARLRIFNNPAVAQGYSPQKGFCDLPHTRAMAKRIKAAGMKLLLDFHYSDTWADPQKQFKPAAWVGLDFKTLTDSVRLYTAFVMQSLTDQGTVPDMVQVGNEINHGMIWPEGAINNLDSLARLIYAGIEGVKAVNAATPIMLHVALGGQVDEAHFFISNMLKRKVPFDVIGLSYYPKWHGTPGDLRHSVANLAQTYQKYIMVAEYSERKQEVNDIAFTAAGKKGIGSFIWEPLNTWEAVFDRDGKANAHLQAYPGIAKKYNVN
ncbi:glycosyl hydrolase 53 family protein [Mucilaginibacter sp. PAMB04274]|uniref:glycosyl hydrolase 53 family protein n=1 Tax=Mucilaginibacter sp. PAMB04274 TaxID=3138568 RepID=UPI0031F6CE48